MKGNASHYTWFKYNEKGKLVESFGSDDPHLQYQRTKKYIYQDNGVLKEEE
jgi:hypothetical protein